SGTGKDLVARAVHACSHRTDGAFIAVNCSAIPETLLEAEFFGARKGSYTGATADREGYFQAARGGTLFLDEIGDLPLPMQSKLLRAIQERQVRSLGSTQEDAVDVRVVSATHRDLATDVASSRFRQDLFYRLNVIEIVVAPPAAAVEPAAPPTPATPAALPMPSDLQAYLDQQEREILVQALHATGFNRTAAAQRLGLSLRQIRYRIARLAIGTPGSQD